MATLGGEIFALPKMKSDVKGSLLLHADATTLCS